VRPQNKTINGDANFLSVSMPMRTFGYDAMTFLD
jgi:hypothetical protein